MKSTLCGRQVSGIGLGTFGMGGRMSPEKGNEDTHIEAIRYAIDKGVNVIDTAEMYAGGHTEEVVGEAIAKYRREDLFIISKVMNQNLHHDAVIKSAEKSLERMQTKYMDLYLIHWPNPEVPVKETISAMEELVSSGMVKNIGVSNFNVQLMKEAMDAAKDNRICANQVEYNYGNRGPESDVIPFCEENGIDVIAYTPIMKGKAAGFSNLSRMAEKYNSTGVQMALRYIMERAYPIPKTSNRDHLDELLKASEIELTAEDYKTLTR